jgi:hypothetical protein
MEYLIPGKKRKDGKRSPYRGRFHLSPDEKLREVPLHTTDKQIAWKKLREIVQEEQDERAGFIRPKKQRESDAAAAVRARRNLHRGAAHHRPRRKICARIEKEARGIGRRSSLEVSHGHHIHSRSRD